MSGSDFSLKPSSLKAALCKIPTGPFLTPSHNPHSLSQRCHLFSPSEDHSTPLMTTASCSHHLSVFPRRTSRGTHDPTRLGLRRGSRFLAEALRRVPDGPQPVSPSLRLPAGHPAGCSRDGGGSARRPSPAPGNGRPTDPGAGTEQPPPSRLGRWAGGGAAPPRCGAGRGGSVRRCDAGGAGTPGGVAAVPPARPCPALRSSAPSKVSTEKGAPPGSALGPAGEKGFAGCCRWRSASGPRVGAASPRCPPARGGEGGGAAAGPEALVPSGVKIGEAQNGIFPLPPAGRLSRHDYCIYPFLPPFLPYVLPGSVPTGSGEDGEENGRFSSVVSGFAAGLPG